MKGNENTLDEYGELLPEFRPYYIVVDKPTGSRTPDLFGPVQLGSGWYSAIWYAPNWSAAQVLVDELRGTLGDVSFNKFDAHGLDAEQVAAFRVHIEMIAEKPSHPLRDSWDRCRRWHQGWLDQKLEAMSDVEKAVFETLRKANVAIPEPALSNVAHLRWSGYSKRPVGKALESLERAGLVEKVGVRGGWRVVEWARRDP